MVPGVEGGCRLPLALEWPDLPAKRPMAPEPAVPGSALADAAGEARGWRRQGPACGAAAGTAAESARGRSSLAGRRE